MLNALWKYMVDNYPPIYSTFVFPYISVIVAFFVPTLIIALFEVSDWTPEWLKKKKIQPNKKVTPEDVWKAFKLIMTQYIFLIGPLYACGFSFVASFLGFSNGKVDPWYIVGLQILFFMVVEDLCQFLGHMALHQPFLYKHIHSWHHEYTAPFAMTGLYAHPFEVIILGFCTFVGPIILRPHFLTFFLWVHVKQAMTLQSHCGYEIKIGYERFLPFKASVEYHDYHHKSFNGPYGTVFTIWDTLAGTDSQYRNYMTLKASKASKKTEKAKNVEDEKIEKAVKAE